MNEAVIALITYYSAMYGINSDLASAVVKVESNFNDKAIGLKGEIGLFQIMPNVVPNVKKSMLSVPSINIEEGIKQLAWAKKHCKHQKNDTWIVCYNRGITGAMKVRNPEKNHYYIKVMDAMKTIKLPSGDEVIIDEIDFEKYNKFKWRLVGQGKYVARNIIICNKGKKYQENVFLHRDIMGLKKGDSLEVDHINGNRLDNRRCNLRLCTRSQNRKNTKKPYINTSGYKGVSRSRNGKRWRARIFVNGKEYSLGVFSNKKDAAKAYNEAAMKFNGEFANVNSNV